MAKRKSKKITDIILERLTDGITQTIKSTMIKNGLKRDSDLVKSVEVKVRSRSVIDILANDYYQYVSDGRRPRVKKVPIDALITWIKKERITPNAGQSINSLAFAIQNGIYKNGIKGKGFADEANRNALDFLEEGYSNMLRDYISNDLEEAFKI